MNLARPPEKYDAHDQAQMRAALEMADAKNLKRGQDAEIIGSARLILTDTVTSTRYALTIASGAVTLVAL